MIEEFAKRWVNTRHWVEEKWSRNPPERYAGIFEEICRMLSSLGVDPDSVEFRYDGDDLGDAIGEVKSHDGTKTWHTVHGYGSCSGCDAFEAAVTPSEFWTIGLHMVQAMTEGAYVER